MSDLYKTLFIVCRADNHYPLVVYTEKERAEWVAGPNGAEVVEYMLTKEEKE